MKNINNVNSITNKYKNKNIIKKHKIITEKLFKKNNIYQNNDKWELIDEFYDNMNRINQKFNKPDLMIFYIKLANELLNTDISKVKEIMKEVIISFEQSCVNNVTINDVLNDVNSLLGDENE